MITQLNDSKISPLSDFTTNEISNISEIYKDEINISIWKRQLSSSLEKSSEYVVNQNPNLEFSEVLQPKDVNQSLQSVIGSSNEIQPFLDDVSYLSFTFCKLFDQKKMWLRLDGIDHPMCPRFHTDKLKCCLVTPYVDPITKWIPHHLVIRSKLRY